MIDDLSSIAEILTYKLPHIDIKDCICNEDGVEYRGIAFVNRAAPDIIGVVNMTTLVIIGDLIVIGAHTVDSVETFHRPVADIDDEELIALMCDIWGPAASQLPN